MLLKLIAKLPTQYKSKSGPPSVLSIIKKSQQYGIDYNIMRQLNYQDLLALLVEYDIDAARDALRLFARERLAASGYEVVEATNEDILRLHNVKR